MKRSSEIALVGFPNSGKTTLFNQLTGMRQRVGNWPGVTVEKKQGKFKFDHSGEVDIVDLPGIQSLLVTDVEFALDAAVTRKYILEKSAHVVINVIDATAFERDLYLTHELLELGVPMVIFLTKTKLAARHGTNIDADKLSNLLDTPVFEADDLSELDIKNIIATQLSLPNYASVRNLFGTLPQLIQVKMNAMKHLEPGIALHCLEGDVLLVKDYNLPNFEKDIESAELDLLIGDWRFGRAHEVALAVVKQMPVLFSQHHYQFDKLAMHRFLGVPCFFLVMYSLFVVSIGLGSLFQPAFDYFSETVFIQWPLYGMQLMHMPNIVMAVVTGIGKGVNTTFSFIPVLFFMFCALAFLEQSGYMVRAAVIIDRAMRFLGLSGKAFIPLIVGLGCNVPAVMATRTLENPRDRILTSLMAPFMSCGARLAIYAVFVSLFFANNAYRIVFSLYLIGILVGILTGWLVRNSLLRGREKPLVMELPRYQLPSFNFIASHGISRVKLFVQRTARIIIPLCMLLTLLSRLDFQGNWLESDLSGSCLAAIGRYLTSLFHPMGITDDNWQAVIGLLSGMAAKEVVVGTLNTLYFVPDFVQVSVPSLMEFIVNLWDSISSQFQALIEWGLHPSTLLQTSEFQPEAGAALVQHFQTKSAAYAYLLFVLLYVPCFSTIATIQREVGRFWAWFATIWSTVIAYVLAVVVYQLLNLNIDLASSLLVISESIAFVAALVLLLKYMLSRLNSVVI